MIIKINELQANMSVIYKINYKNNKFYIGRTNDLKRRISEHLNAWKKLSYKSIQDCDQAIYEQGGIEEIEILEFVPDIKLLPEREKYWIEKYNAFYDPMGYNKSPGGTTSDQVGEESGRAVFTNEQVLDIRKRRYYGERKKDVYQDYSNYSFGTFEKIWLGNGYTNIGQEYIIPTNFITRQEYSSRANAGVQNGRAKCTKEQVLNIRFRYDNGESIISIAKDFPYITESTIRRIATRQTYKNIE